MTSESRGIEIFNFVHWFAENKDKKILSGVDLILWGG